MLRLLPVLAALCAPLALAGDPPPPSFVVVLLDDIGTDKVAVYGDAPRPAPTPALDRLATKGILFRNAWATPACSPTRASLLTGRYADRNGVGSAIRPGDGVNTPLSREQITIPATLGGSYRSVALGKWHLSDTGDAAVHARLAGFDAVSSWSGLNDYFSWSQNLNGRLSPQSGYYPVTLGSQALRAIQYLERPQFIYYCPRLAHSPFHAPPAHLRPQSTPGSSNFELHRQMSEAMDTILDRVLEHVDLETTYLFVLSDNGSPASCVEPPYVAGKVKGSLYEGGVRVPFFVAGPGVPSGVECERLVQVSDFFATILELAGMPPAVGFAEDSISFAPLLTNPDAPHARSFLYASTFGYEGSSIATPNRRAIRTERFKLIHLQDEQRYELYDLQLDPFENANLLVGSVTPQAGQIRDRLLALMPTIR